MMALDAVSRDLQEADESAPGMSRTDNPLIKRQPTDSHNVSSCHALSALALPVGHLMATDVCQVDSDLIIIVHAWSTLPEALKARIVAMVEAAMN